MLTVAFIPQEIIDYVDAYRRSVLVTTEHAFHRNVSDSTKQNDVKDINFFSYVEIFYTSFGCLSIGDIITFGLPKILPVK